MKKIKRIIKLVLDDIAEIYLYFLGFYFVCLILSLFFERWREFFNWPAFHMAVVVFGILSLVSEKGRKFILYEIELIKSLVQRRLIKFKTSPSIKTFFGILILFVSFLIKNLLSLLKILSKIKKLTKKDYIRIGIIAIILGYSLYKEINSINFLVLSYALVSILFILESRIAGAMALLFLVSCPILLILEKQALAETMAIYAYYFLVITVVTQIREYLREERAKKVIHS